MGVHVRDSIRRIKAATARLRGETGVPEPLAEVAPIAGASVGAGTGAAAGAVLGSFAGPPGMIAGALIGAAAGAATGVALSDEQTDEAQHDSKLDDAIGVTAGNLGAAKPGAPAAKRGTFSAASSGGGGGANGTDSAPDEGPMPHGD